MTAARRTAVPAPEKPTTSAPVLDAIASPRDAAPLERVEVDPTTLTLDANARADLKITEQFRALVREHGVLVPLLCRRDALGQLLVVDGQRRLVTALELGLPSVPIALLPAVGDDEARLWDQLVTNDGREALNAGETAAAYQQLSLMGRSAESIAKRAGIKRETVESALAVAASKAATSTATKVPDADLEQLTAIAEFDGDADAVKALRTVIERTPSQFAHTLQTLRDERDSRAAIAAHREQLAEAVLVLDEPIYLIKNAESLTYLSHKPKGRAITPAEHADCPGHAVRLTTRRDAAGVMVVAEEWACTKWKSAGHVNRYANPSSGATSGPLDDDEKAERRTLVERNKKAQAAEVVRREFLAEFLRRKKLPADAPVYVARLVYPGSYANHPEADIARTLVYGDKVVDSRDERADIATPRLAMRALVALAAARVEASMPKDFWRSPHTSHGVHLRQLEAWGYVLADVEQLALTNLGAK